MKAALRHKFDGGASYEDLLVSARIAEMDQGSSKAVQSQQATITDASMAKQVDHVLSVLETFEQRWSLLLQMNLERHYKQLGYEIREHLVVDTCSQVLVSNVGRRGIKSTAVL